MVFEILGVNFLEIIKRYDYKGVPLPLVRKLARQCLIGLDYMHRECRIIHTDFKPENVVICLSDKEILEIGHTGQLTTTKMYGNAETIKRINAKIAGTLILPESATTNVVAEKKVDNVEEDVEEEGDTSVYP
jgi:serine/threonine protein kinase